MPPEQRLQQRKMPGITLSQTIAIVMVYSRMFKVFLAGPVVIVVAPLVFLVTGWITTSGNGLIDLLLVMGFYQGHVSLVRSMTPTKQDYEEVMSKRSARYLLHAFLLSVGVGRFVIRPLCDTLGISIAWNVNIMLFARLAAAIAIIQATVLVRYIGPQSFMRCSSFPLVSNPVISGIRVLLRYFVVLLFGPISFAQQLQSPGKYYSIRRGRRYQHPIILATFANMMVSVLSGFAVSQIYLLYLLNRYHPSAPGLPLISSIFSMLLPLALYVRGNAHELDPLLYTGELDSNWTATILEKGLHAMGVAALSVAMAFVTAYLSIEHFPAWSVTATLVLFTSLALLSFWVSAFDHFLRRALFFESYFDDQDADVTVSCLLENSPIVDAVLSKDFDSIQGPMAFQELRRMESLIREMGKFMTKRVEDQIECPLEEDIMRFNVLQSFGGGVEGPSPNTSISIPKRQREHIIKHIAEKHAILSSYGNRRVQILVRALCVFAGGLGEAIHLSLEKRQFRFTEERWKLPPGSIAEMQYVLQAITWIFRVVSNLESQAGATQLSILVPAVLFAIFRLRSSISVVLTDVTKGGRSSLEIEPSLLPRLEHVFAELDKAAAFIFFTQSNTTVEQMPLLPLEKPTIEWLQHCCAALTKSN
ncbi:hypothetical protein ACA910_012752 [Epithemia clementina (nom. ined.)]